MSTAPVEASIAGGALDAAEGLNERIEAYATNVLPKEYDFDPSLSVDENYMVLVLIYARLSMSKRGNMACIIVDPTACRKLQDVTDSEAPPIKRRRVSSPSSLEEYPRYPGAVLAHSNNFPQPHVVAIEMVQKAPSKHKQPAVAKPGQTNFGIKASQFPELHAEARSICLAASRGTPLDGATAYISFPPCQACLPLLVATGIKRLVYRQTLGTTTSVELCERAGVTRVEIVDKELDERLKDTANRWWKDRGEGRDETRGRLDRWWRTKEDEIMGPLYAAAVEAKQRNEQEQPDEAENGVKS
ncbi:hypothetical protein JCM10212_001332 [Sporobolomyces blumeae]